MKRQRIREWGSSKAARGKTAGISGRYSQRISRRKARGKQRKESESTLGLEAECFSKCRAEHFSKCTAECSLKCPLGRTCQSRKFWSKAGVGGLFWEAFLQRELPLRAE